MLKWIVNVGRAVRKALEGLMTGSGTPTPKQIAIAQIQNVRLECDQTLALVKNFSPPDPATNQVDPTYRLIATPMLYSIWERCFSTCHAVTLRLLRDVTTTAGAVSPSRRAIWLIRAGFFRSFVDRLKTSKHSATKPKKGEFLVLTEFLSQFDSWAQTAFDPAIPLEDLVMTFSNVNPKVVELNAEALGIASYAKFQAIKFGRLNDLLLHRNEIGHGARISPPSNKDFIELTDFTEKLVAEYTDVFIEWINIEF